MGLRYFALGFKRLAENRRSEGPFEAAGRRAGGGMKAVGARPARRRERCVGGAPSVRAGGLRGGGKVTCSGGSL